MQKKKDLTTDKRFNGIISDGWPYQVPFQQNILDTDDNSPVLFEKEKIRKSSNILSFTGFIEAHESFRLGSVCFNEDFFNEHEQTQDKLSPEFTSNTYQKIQFVADHQTTQSRNQQYIG